MFAVVVPAWLDRYARMIQRWADEYPEAWGLIYQAEVRAREEHTPDVRERLEEEYAEALVRNHPTRYNPKMPWNAVWEALVMHESAYWYKAIEKPGLLLLAGTARISEFLDEDVKTKRPTEPGANHERPVKQHRTEGTIVPYVPNPPVPTGGATPRGGKGRGSGKGEDLSVWDGSKYLKNRAGASLCRGYQTGACLRLNSWNLCAQDGCSAHQCEICLMVGHGSSEVNK